MDVLLEDLLKHHANGQKDIMEEDKDIVVKTQKLVLARNVQSQTKFANLLVNLFLQEKLLDVTGKSQVNMEKQEDVAKKQQNVLERNVQRVQNAI